MTGTISYPFCNLEFTPCECKKGTDWPTAKDRQRRAARHGQAGPYIKGDHFFDVIHSYDVIPARCHSCMGGWVRVHNQGSIFTELHLGGNIVGAVLYAGGGSIVGRKCL